MTKSNFKKELENEFNDIHSAEIVKKRINAALQNCLKRLEKKKVYEIYDDSKEAFIPYSILIEEFGKVE